MATNTPSKHIGRKIGLSLLAVLILLVLALLIAQTLRYIRDPSPYRTFITPRLEFSLFEINELGADKTTLNAAMLINNPIPLNLRADSIAYELYIDKQEIIKSTYRKSVLIRAWDSSQLVMPVTVFTDKLMNVLTDAEKAGKDSVVYGIKTSFIVPALFNKHMSFTSERLLPLIYIPKIKMEKVVWDSLNAEGVTLYFHTTIVNKNKFPLNFKDLAFQFAIADNPWVKGAVPGEIDIPDSSVVPLVLPLRISFKQVGKSIWPLIKEGKNTDYKLNLSLKLVSESNALKNSMVVLKDVGAIKEVVKLAKDEKQNAKEQAAKHGEDDKGKKKKKDKVKIEHKKKS